MISTTASHAILVAIGIFPAQSAILESYESNWTNLPPGVTSIWEFVLDVDNEWQSLIQVFADFPANPGFWVWEGVLIVENDNPLDAIFNGGWRRATKEEVWSWDESTRSTYVVANDG
jgi:hypothetical protein